MINRVGQNRIYTLYMTVCMVIFLLKIQYVHRIYVLIYMVLAHPGDKAVDARPNAVTQKRSVATYFEQQ